MTKKILGLDLGTNSIGWAMIEIDREKQLLRIMGLGSRIIPMDGQEFSKFNAGQKITSAAGNKTTLHRARITKERYLLRRDRLHLVLNLLEALPEHYKIEIDFVRNGKKCGKFKDETEPKIAYLPIKNSENKHAFYFEDAFEEMLKDLQKVNPDIKNEKGKRVPKDWTIYYLRQKALKEKISLEELAWVLLSYNQKRGTELDEIENENEKSEIKELLDLKVIGVEQKSDNDGIFYEIRLNDAENFTYKEYSTEQLTFKDDIKEVLKISKLDDAGNIEKEKEVYQISDLYNLTLLKIEHKETDDKTFKHLYNFIYSNGWTNEKKKEKWNKSYNDLGKKLEEEYKKEKPKIFSDLFVISNKYNFKGQPEKPIPSIKIPDFNSEGSKDWTLLKKKTEKDAAKFNIENGYVNNDGSAKHYISPKIYDVLTNDAKTGERTKIIGGLFQTIDRKFYREELRQIIATQKQYHKSFEDQSIFEQCVKLLYPNNKEHTKALLQNKNAIAHLLIEDTLLYQRPLKSKKSDISDCKYEVDYWKEEVDTKTGEITERPVYKKAVSASHPLFQEFRIWDKIHNIRLIQLEVKNVEGNFDTNVDITSQYFKPEDYQTLFEHFNKRSTVAISDFLEFCKKRFGLDIGKKGERKILWNYPEEEEFKGNETRKSFEIRFKRCGFQDFNRFMTQEKEIGLWHYLYSVNLNERKKVSETKDISSLKFGKTSIQNFFAKYFKDENVEDDVIEKLCKDFENYPKFPSKYAAYSSKSLHKLLSVMRVGYNFLTQETFDERWQEKYPKRANIILEKCTQIDWSANAVDYSNVMVNEVNAKQRELPYPKGLFNTFKNFASIEDFKFLNLTQGCYFIYGRHSELAQAKYWDSPQKIRDEINKELKHHSLNNPVAEKVLKETMKVVADVWEYYGASAKNFFSKIHLEVARELQKSNQEKKEITERQKNSRTENERLRNILEEFLSQSPYNAKRGNQDHFERLKIVEEGAKTRSYSEKDFYVNNKAEFDKKEIDGILKKQKISRPDFEKYKLWIEQGYRSPYTNKPITLTDLFNGNKYNIDHILPRASVTNDSLNNKVVCEAFLNRFKSDKTAREFIAQFGGRSHTIFDENLNRNIEFELVDEEAYVSLVKTQFRDAKRFILLSKEIPTGFTDSQMNNAKHIARKAMELLSHVVREEGEVEFRSKNLLPVSGAITDRLKKEWRFNQVWTALLTPRFERLNTLYKSENFGKYEISKSGHRYFDINTQYILDINEKFELKRLDHRHHALDALIVALCTENHVQYINNINSGITNKKKEKIDAIKKQRAGIKRQIMYSEPDKENPNEKVWIHMLPGSFRIKPSEGNDKSSIADMDWQNNYTNTPNKDYKKIVLEALKHCIVSFKNDFKLVSKSSNKYESYYEENGNLRLDANGVAVKSFISQKNDNKKHWSVRKPLHKDNPSSRIEVGVLNKTWYNSLDNLIDIIDVELRNKTSDIIEKISEEESASEYLKLKHKEAKTLLKLIEQNDKKLTKEKDPGKRDLLHDKLIKLVSDYETDYKPFLLFKDEEIIETIAFNEIKYRKYQPLIDLADRKTQSKKITTLEAMLKKLNKIADEDLKSELLKHLEEAGNDIDVAFSIEGIEEYNKKRKEAGKYPLRKIPISESGSGKYTVGKKYTNKHKWVEAEQGTNLYFAVYADSQGNRSYETVSLRNAIDRVIHSLNVVPNVSQQGYKLLFTLSPNDLVYVPIQREVDNFENIEITNLDNVQKTRVFSVNDFSSAIYFVPVNVSSHIISKEIDMNFNDKKNKLSGSYDIKTASFEGKQIKDTCIKLNVDRLGNVSKA